LRKKSLRRSISAAGIGTALEGFDLIIFAYLAVVISKVFFPGSEANALLLAFATYGASFLTRPLGAIVLGLYGDVRGRKAALSLSLVLMGVGSIIIALMPSYASIGPLAPIGILCARLLQGFAAGAEQGSASVFAAEQDGRRRAEFIGWMIAFFGLTMIMAAGASTFLSWAFPPAELESWAWRLPFLFGALVCPIGWYIRRKTEETEAFRASDRGQSAAQVARQLLGTYSWRMAVAVLLYAPGIAVTYLTIYLPSFAIGELGLSSTWSFAAGVLSGATLAICAPLLGRLSDRHVGRYPMFLFTTLAMGLLIWPLFAWLTASPSWGRLASVQFILAVLSAGHAVVTTTLVVEIFPIRGRVTAASLTGAVAFMTFGGFAPLVYSALVTATGDLVSPSYYVILCAALCLPSMFWVRAKGFHRLADVHAESATGPDHLCVNG
jgi:MHS family proline/betaine transporter-like MFS transporter